MCQSGKLYIKYYFCSEWCTPRQCLGSFAFLLFINDIVEEFGDFLSVKLFADDVKMYVVMDDVNKSFVLQSGLDILCNVM